MSIGLSFHCRTGSSILWRKRRSCSASLTSRKYLSRMIPDSMSAASNRGAISRKRVACFSVQIAHHAFDARAVVPRAVEDHDLAGRGKVRDVALHEDLRLLAVAGGRKRRDPEDPRADLSVRRLMTPPLPAASRPSKMMTIRVPEALYPSLQIGELGLQLADLPVVVHLPVARRRPRRGRRRPSSCDRSSSSTSFRSPPPARVPRARCSSQWPPEKTSVLHRQHDRLQPQDHPVDEPRRVDRVQHEGAERTDVRILKRLVVARVGVRDAVRALRQAVELRLRKAVP
jgi:hypothetical protein